MKVSSSFDSMEVYFLQGNDWLTKQRVAGKVAAKAISTLVAAVKDKTKLSTLDLSKLAEEVIINNNCTPTFKGYKGFPESVCISVNNELVHGIPKNYYLEEGDVISFDLGATFEGAIADTAVTVIYGEPKSKEHVKLIETTESALLEAIKKIKIGDRIGVIGETIYKIGRSNGFAVVDAYGGHGLSWNTPHSNPFISNKSNSNTGIRFQQGMTFAIEPLFVIGSDNYTKTEADGWTVSTKNISSHFEHSVYIGEDNVEIITQRE